MRTLAEAERFEEAATVRERADAVTRAVHRHRRLDMMGRIDGLLVKDQAGVTIELGAGGSLSTGQLFESDRPGSLDEALCVASWLQRNADDVELLSASGTFASALPSLPDYRPRNSSRRTGS